MMKDIWREKEEKSKKWDNYETPIETSSLSLSLSISREERKKNEKRFAEKERGKQFERPPLKEAMIRRAKTQPRLTT